MTFTAITRGALPGTIVRVRRPEWPARTYMAINVRKTHTGGAALGFVTRFFLCDDDVHPLAIGTDRLRVGDPEDWQWYRGKRHRLDRERRVGSAS